MNGNTVVGFLPVSYHVIENGSKIERGITRSQCLKMLHLCILQITDALMKKSYQGFACIDNNGVTRKCHPCLASYCCDLPEGKDLSSVRNGNSSTKNCH